MAGLPSKYAKLGFKRGWAAYNKKRKPKKRGKIKMAKRKRRHSRRSYGAKRIAGGLSMGSAIKVLTGAALAAVYEVFVSPMIPLDQMIKNIVELAAGLMLAGMPGMPMPVRAFGAALATINAYSLILPYISSSSSASGAVNSGW
jgi:hypothetical protein